MKHVIIFSLLFLTISCEGRDGDGEIEEIIEDSEIGGRAAAFGHQSDIVANQGEDPKSNFPPVQPPPFLFQQSGSGKAAAPIPHIGIFPDEMQQSLELQLCDIVKKILRLQNQVGSCPPPPPPRNHS